MHHFLFTRVALALLCAALAGTAPLAGQESAAALDALLSEAEASSPEIVAARRTADAVAARVPRAGALPDPMLGLSVMNLPAWDPSLGREMMTMTTLQVGEQLPFPGKLRLREEAAGFFAEAADWEAERVRQEVVERVKQAYYEVYFVDRAIAVTQANEALVGDFARLTATKYGVGTGAQPDVLRAQVERTGLAEQLVSLGERRTSAVARLNALLDRPSDAPLATAALPASVQGAALEADDRPLSFASTSLSGLGPFGDGSPAPGVPPVRELQRLALEHNPMIQAHVRRVAARRSAVELAGKAALPDLNVSVAYSRRPNFPDFMNVSLSAPLPLFRGRKQDQLVLEEEANLAEHEARHAAMVNELNAEIASLAAEMARARDQLVLLDDGILPQARTTVSSATAAYQVGSVDFLSLLEAQITLFRHELDYHRLLADFAGSAASLERAVGTEILP